MASELKNEILAQAKNIGFDLCGIASLDLPDRDQKEHLAFIDSDRHGSMQWMADHLHLRLDAKKIFPKAQSALTLGSVYYRPETEEVLSKARVRVARYAHGRDYHRVLRLQARRLISAIRVKYPEVEGRVCVDSVPVSERAFARMAGLGFQGKNTNLIHPTMGSYFLLCVILLNVSVESDEPILDRCGSCRLCVDACPTGALTPYKMDARKCISYLTIETKEPIPKEFHGNHGFVFGCDICQEVCPYNKKPASVSKWFFPSDQMLSFMESGDTTNWQPLKEGNALGRITPERMKKNIEAFAFPESENA